MQLPFSFPPMLFANGGVRGTGSKAFMAVNAIAVALSTGVLIYAVYLATKPAQWGDSGFFLAEIVSGNRSFSGPLAHPGYKIVAAAFYSLLGLNGIFALNALCNGLTSYFIFRTAQELGASVRAGFIGASGFFLSQPAFWLSANVEVYPLHNAVLMFGIYFVLRGLGRTEHIRWRPYAGGVALIVLSISLHQLSTLVLPALALDLAHRLGPGVKLNAKKYARPGVLIGVAVLLAAVAVLAVSSFTWFAGYFGFAESGERWANRYFSVSAIIREPKYFLLAIYGLGVLSIGLGLRSRSDQRVRFIRYAVLFQLVFVLTYDIPDRFTFLLPALSLLSILLALLLDGFSGVGKRVVLAGILCPILVGVLASAHMFPPSLFPQHYNANRYRSDVEYFLSPYFRDASAQRFVDDLSAIAHDRPDRAVTLIGDDWTPNGALISALSTGYARNIKMVGLKDLDYGMDGCPQVPHDRLYVVFRRSEGTPVEARCVQPLGRLWAVRD